ncbi:hypothetical protein EV715DRAFT_204833 [Schizophyllum commune]
MLLQRIKEVETQNALLMQTVYELQGELRGARNAHDALLKRLDGYAGDSAPAPISRTAPPSTPAEATLLAIQNPPRIVVLNRNEYPRVQFWFPNDFLRWVRAKLDVSALGTTTEIRLQYRFLEDADGLCIQERKRIMLEVLYSTWRTLLHVPDLLPKTWGRASLEVRMFVWATMEEAFVELRFCDGHWKVQKLCTLNYPWWYAKNARRGPEGGNSDSDDDDGDDDKKGSGGRGRRCKIAGKRSASVVDATAVLAAPVKRPRTKVCREYTVPSCTYLDQVASIFGTGVSKKPVPSPLSTVTTPVTSTPAVIEAAPSSSTTSTILSDDPSGAPSSSGSPDADDRGATPGLQDVASAREGAFSEAPEQQTTSNNAEEARPRAVQKDFPTPVRDTPRVFYSL